MDFPVSIQLVSTVQKNIRGACLVALITLFWPRLKINKLIKNKKIKNSILANDQPMSQWKKINLNLKKVANVLGM